jgi:hypothetical protein
MNLTTIHIYCSGIPGTTKSKNVPKLDFLPTSFDLLCNPCNLLPYSRGYEYPKLRTAALRDHRQIRQMMLQIDEPITYLRKIVVVCFLVAFLLFQLDSFKMLCNKKISRIKTFIIQERKIFAFTLLVGFLMKLVNKK